jgi:hypothetical protein
LEEEALFDAGTVEEVVLGVPVAATVVEGDVVVVLTVVEVVGFTEDDVVVGFAVVDVVERAHRLRDAAAAGKDVPRVVMPTVTANAATRAAPNTTARFERTTCIWVSSSMSQLIDNDQRTH